MSVFDLKTKVTYILSPNPYKENWLFRHCNYKYQEIEIFTKFDKKLNCVEFMSLKITKLYLHSLHPPLTP